MSPINYAVAEEVTKLTPNEISKLTNPQLKVALAALIGDEQTRLAAGPSNADLMQELKDIKKEINGIPQLKKEIAELKKENQQFKQDFIQVFEILHHQQIFIESV